MRRGCLIAGTVLLVILWLGPLPELARDVFSAHMTMHMGVVAVAAPLLALGMAGGRMDPVSWRPRWFHPVAASFAELVVVWGWHAPGLHHVARSGWMGLAAEQSMFLAAGLMVWLSAFGGEPAISVARDGVGAGRRAAAGVVGLLLTAMHMTLLGALLALAGRPIYHDSSRGDAAGPGAEVASVPEWLPFAGLTPLQDQHLGGAIMLLVGGIAYLAGGLYLTARVLRASVWSRGRAAKERSRVAWRSEGTP